MARHNWPNVPGFESTRPSIYPVLHIGHRRRRRVRRAMRRATRAVLRGAAFPFVLVRYLMGFRP